MKGNRNIKKKSQRSIAYIIFGSIVIRSRYLIVTVFNLSWAYLYIFHVVVV